jgi:hypothetical protein
MALTNIHKLAIIYVITTILEIVYFEYFAKMKKPASSVYVNPEIEFNLKNAVELDAFLNKTILKHKDNLKKKYEHYLDWVRDLNKGDNSIVTYKGRKYSIFVYEKTHQIEEAYTEDVDFISRIAYIPEYYNLAFSDIIQQVNDNHIIFEKLPTGEDLIKNMYNMADTYIGTNTLDYYWISSDSNKVPIKKHSIFTNFKHEVDKDNTIEGVIGIGYATQSLHDKYSHIYYDRMHTVVKIAISLFIFISTIGLDFTTKHDHMAKALIFFFTLNLYVCYFMSKINTLSTIGIEEGNVKDLNEGILGIAFLVAVNIFIIDTMSKSNSTVKKSERKFVYNESALLFCVSLILLLTSMFKSTNYTTVEDIREKSTISQLAFNMAIIVNLFIFLNYLTFISSNKNMF